MRNTNFFVVTHMNCGHAICHLQARAPSSQHWGAIACRQLAPARRGGAGPCCVRRRRSWRTPWSATSAAAAPPCRPWAAACPLPRCAGVCAQRTRGNLCTVDALRRGGQLHRLAIARGGCLVSCYLRCFTQDCVGSCLLLRILGVSAQADRCCGADRGSWRRRRPPAESLALVTPPFSAHPIPAPAPAPATATCLTAAAAAAAAEGLRTAAGAAVPEARQQQPPLRHVWQPAVRPSAWHFVVRGAYNPTLPVSLHILSCCHVVNTVQWVAQSNIIHLASL